MKRRDFIKKSLLGLLAAPFAQAAMPSVAEAEQVPESPNEDTLQVYKGGSWIPINEPISCKWEVSANSDRAPSGDMIGFYGGEPVAPEHLTLSDLVTALKEGGVLEG